MYRLVIAGEAYDFDITQSQFQVSYTCRAQSKIRISVKGKSLPKLLSIAWLYHDTDIIHGFLINATEKVQRLAEPSYEYDLTCQQIEAILMLRLAKISREDIAGEDVLTELFAQNTAFPFSIALNISGAVVLPTYTAFRSQSNTFFDCVQKIVGDADVLWRLRFQDEANAILDILPKESAISPISLDMLTEGARYESLKVQERRAGDYISALDYQFFLFDVPRTEYVYTPSVSDDNRERVQAWLAQDEQMPSLIWSITKVVAAISESSQPDITFLVGQAPEDGTQDTQHVLLWHKKTAKITLNPDAHEGLQNVFFRSYSAPAYIFTWQSLDHYILHVETQSLYAQGVERFIQTDESLTLSQAYARTAKYLELNNREAKVISVVAHGCVGSSYEVGDGYSFLLPYEESKESVILQTKAMKVESVEDDTLQMALTFSSPSLMVDLAAIIKPPLIFEYNPSIISEETIMTTEKAIFTDADYRLWIKPDIYTGQTTATPDLFFRTIGVCI